MTRVAPAAAPQQARYPGIEDESRPRPRSGAGAGWTIAFDLLLLIGALVILHIAVSGPIPSGGDGGNWLALAREGLGEQVMSAQVVYEPVFITMLGSLLRVFGPVDALLVSAFIAEAFLLTSVYFVVRRAGRGPALVSSVLVGVAGYRLEAYAWGAYPQILALGFGLLTVWAVVRFVNSGRWPWLVLVGLGVVTVLSTHKLVGGLLLMATPAAALHSLWIERFRRDMWKWAGLAVLVAGVVGAFFVSSWLGASAEGVEPTLNPLGLSRSEQLLFAFEEASVPWLVLIVIALIGFGMRSWSREAAPVVSTSFGWVLASLVGFLALGEPRVLIQAQAALIPVTVLVIWRWWRSRSPLSGWKRQATVLLGFLAIAVLGSVVLTGLHRYDLAADWYRVVGERELEALEGLRDAAEPGDMAVASRGPNGNPIGWWVQGYAGIPTYTNIDTAFLAFPDERAQAEVAAGLFAAPPEEAAALLDEIGARFLILDRRGADVGWLTGGDTAALDALSDGTLRIMEVSGGS